MTRSRNVLIAAEASLCASLVEQFARCPDLTLVEADTETAALELLATKAPDLVILDETLAGPAMERLRDRFAGPVLLIALHGRNDAAKAPADERIERPFRFTALLTRVRAMLRRREARREFSVGPHLFRPDSNELVRSNGTRLRLTDKETAILTRLAQANAAAVSREMLLRDVWGYSPAVTTRTLETHIHRLRRKLEPDHGKASVLVTDRGGYRLVSSKIPGSPVAF